MNDERKFSGTDMFRYGLLFYVWGVISGVLVTITVVR
jgi:hypothetical protein